MVPLEETMNGDDDSTKSKSPLSGAAGNNRGLLLQRQNSLLLMSNHLDGKKVVSSCMATLILLVLCDSMWSAPENRILKPDFSQRFLQWVQQHPAQGLIWILLAMSVAVIFMIPIGTPLTLGCGYIYKGAYGWRLGVLLATFISMLGSAVGAVCCFLLGRYLMREQVRKWIRKYPLFDAIDIASAEHGLRIMAMLYLTPILPLGPVSYMCGTTSMALSHFILAKVAALPLMMLYVFIGASTGTLMSKSDGGGGGGGISESEVKNIEENQTLIISGIVLSAVSIACITHYIKKELNKILERQKRAHDGNENNDADAAADQASSAIEMGKTTTAPRQRKH